MTEKRYSRNLGAISEAEQEIVKGTKIFLAGCGGLGGNLLAHLLRLGVGSVTAIDGDVFEESNLNRQLLSSLSTLGKSKAAAALDFGREINPSVKLFTSHIFLTEDNADSLIAGHDLVFDALDNLESRRVLAASCDRLGIPYVYGAIHGWTAQVGIFPPGQAANRISMLYPQTAALTDSSCLSFTPSFCASLQVAEAVKYLLGKDHCLTDRILYADLLDQEFEEIPFLS